MRRPVIVLLAAWAFCASLPSVHAQSERASRQKDLLVDIDVGYNTAYREKSWVPVTVDVVNEQRDFDGVIEVRTYDYSNVQQSPAYRLAAQCPRNSRKRYSLYVYLDGAERVEAWLYERGRRAVDAPAYMQVRPIEKDDLLVAVLDDDPFNYGFLYAAVQREGKVVRLSRFGLPTSDLERLPDLPQAYDSFDAIVFGDIDPDRVAQHRRTLIADYVQRGGTLIVSTGTNAADYRNSWLAPTLGADVGETTVMMEADLGATLPESMRSGLRPDRQAVLAALRPTPGVVSTGIGQTLATRRTSGRGRIYTVAIDATSHALQDTPGYQALWRDMLLRPTGRKPLNFDAFSNTVVQMLPNLSGVKIRPLGWVMTYLLLYLGVAIVANWLFWNALKRREMAWFCLIGFSFAFTAYAVLFGRSGNLREAQHQTVGVVQVSPGEKLADVYSLTGILSSRTRTYSGALVGESVTVRDAATRLGDEYYAFTGVQPTAVRNTRPFGWDQTPPGRVESLNVGASELRMALVQARVPVDGAFEGSIEIDQDGIRGTLQNATGYEFTQAALLYNGVLYPMSVRPGSIQIALDGAGVSRIHDEEAQVNPDQFRYMGYFGDVDQTMMRNYAQRSLFVDETYQIDYYFPPHVVAWSTTAPGAGLAPDQPMTHTSAQTLVVSPVGAGQWRSISPDAPLSIDVGEGWHRSASGPPLAGRYLSDTSYVTSAAAGPLRVRLPDNALEVEDGEIIVELFWQSINPNQRVILVPSVGSGQADSANFAWHQERAGNDENVGYGVLNRRTTYRIADWPKYLDPTDRRTLAFGVEYWTQADAAEGSDGTVRIGRSRVPLNIAPSVYSASARFVPHEKPANPQGAWPQWQ